MKNLINWKLFFILLAACVITSFMVLPYSLSLVSSEIEITMKLMLLAFLQSLVMFAVMIFLGLLLSKQTGMGLPFLQGLLEGKPHTVKFRSILLPSMGWGILAGLLIVLLMIPFNKLIPELQTSETSIAAWKSILASFYGGIAEEVLLRLFIVSLLVWITFKIKKTKEGLPPVWGVWTAIILASVIFGIGHLPATSLIVPLTWLVITRAIVLNGIGGIIFGWLYWKKGLESAIIAHFCADIVLHVLTPILVRMFNIA